MAKAYGKDGGVRCPECQSPVVRVRRTPFERKVLFFIYAYSCPQCWLRFYRWMAWPTSVRLLGARLGATSSLLAPLLWNRVAFSLACMSLIIAGLSVFVILGPRSNPEPSVEVTRSNGAETGRARQNTIPRPIGVADFTEGQTKAGARSVPPNADPRTLLIGNEPPSATTEAFIVRVGSFRNPSNAERVVAVLHGQTSDVRTDVLPSGLHVVMLGPFAEESAANEAARSVQDAMGLLPLVLRFDRR